MANPFQNWTAGMLADHNARIAAGKRPRSDSDPSPPPEAAQEGKTQPGADVRRKIGTAKSEEEIAVEILAEIERRGWLCFRSAPCYRTGRRPGEWDLTILAGPTDPRVFFVELKKHDGKLSTEQIGVIAWARKLGHEVSVCRSLKEFLDVVDG